MRGFLLLIILTSTPGPIAVFDSGYGGLTVLDKILEEIPEYDFIYLGDNARTPYGSRSYDVVYNYTLQATKQLFSKGAHLVILACNTASAKALKTIQQNDLSAIGPNRRVLGVIRPSAEAIGDITSSNHVGILGTPGTIRSNSYPIEISKLHPNITVTQEACPLWVPLVESNQFNSQGGEFFIRQHIDNLLTKDPEIDTIVLGCTHYPILQSIIEKFVPQGVKVLAQGELVATSLKDYLKRHPEMDAKCAKNGQRKFYTTENPEIFDEKASVFLNTALKAEQLSF
jgi:glutamate racemase